MVFNPERAILWPAYWIWNFYLVLLLIDIIDKDFEPLMLTAKSATRKPTLTAKEHFVYSQILNGQL